MASTFWTHFFSHSSTLASFLCSGEIKHFQSFPHSAPKNTKVGEPLGFLVSFFASLLPHFLASSMAFSSAP